MPSGWIRLRRGFEGALQIDYAVMVALAPCFSDDELDLSERALEAQQQGQTPSPQQFAALQRLNAEWTRLRHLANADGPAEAQSTEDGSG